jgi:hypothetical protein
MAVRSTFIEKYNYRATASRAEDLR